jgi:hypothetical protein
VNKVILSGAAAAFLMLGTVSFAAPPAPASAFVSDKSKDYFGYFLPAEPLKIGKWQLKDFFVAPTDDLKSFESGKADKAFGGVMIEFDDTTSPQKTGENGQPFYTRDTRILPLAYHVGMDKVTFAGTDKALGPVTFVGTFDKDYFKKPSPDVPHPDDRPMLRGKLTIGGKVYPVAFNWFAGD